MNIYDKKYQVFISSTYVDLNEARNEVIKVLLNLHQLPIGMEMFSADNDEQWTVIQETIERSDYYILIIGQRYGSLTREGISYTEKEFEYALSIGVPVMVFVQDEQVATTPQERDAEPEKVVKLRQFRNKATGDKMANFWKTEADLAQQVQTALIKSFMRHPRTGWVRADQVVSPQVTTELAELSRENRELKQENEELKSLQNSKRPVLKVWVNNSDRLDIPFQKELVGNYPSIKPVTRQGFPTAILDQYDANEVEKYNAAIVTRQTAVDEYNLECEAMQRIVETKVAVSFAVENTGNAKANEVFVELTFPPELSILTSERAERKHINRPAFIPEDPVNTAVARRNSSMPIIPLLGGSSRNSNDTLRNVAVPIVTNNFTAKNNLLTISFDTLLHTRRRTTSGELYIVAWKSGTYKIKVIYMCEEWNEQMEDVVEVVVS